MNILLFVSSILMILSLMTYARIDRFRTFTGTEAQFERYMSSVERSYINETALQWYKTTHAPKGGNTSRGETGTGTSRLSFLIFIDEKMRNDNPEEYEVMARWAKNLMRVLYGKQPFFRVAEIHNPSFLDKIIEGIGYAAEELPPKQRPSTAADLSNLYLAPDVAEVFYQMLKGCLVQPENEQKSESMVGQQVESVVEDGDGGDSEDGEDDDSGSGDSEEYVKTGYDSLLNHITLRKGGKIKVYLASRKLLEAIFGQASIAENIINNRKMLYHAVKSQSVTAAEATNQFQDAFKGYISGNEDTYLNFKVSLTNPSSYD